MKESGKPYVDEGCCKADCQPLLRSRLYKALIIIISALQQDLDSLTEVLLELRVVWFGVSFSYFGEPPPNPGNEKRRSRSAG